MKKILKDLIMNSLEKYDLWKQNVKDEVLLEELSSMNNKDIEDAFYKNLSFGTGGLRGVLGAGTNRMNIYVVAKASQGLANYINKHYDNPSVAIGYDTRTNSDLFSKIASCVFSNNGIKVYLYSQAFPVPMLSYATRYLKCSAGVMITASHNPAKYNGYKVYGEDGCQITTEASKQILKEIDEINEFNVDINDSNKELIKYIDNEVYDSYIEEVKKQSFLYEENINKDIKIIYTPLNGTGFKPVTRVLKELNYKNIITVKKQEDPDGNFPTCPYPNPEILEAMSLGIETAKDNNADILIATDPDCDRVGVAVKDDNDFIILNGNQVGVLLFNYILERKTKHKKLPNNPILIKTIVSTNMAKRIADKYNVKTINVLTGYKYIGEQIGLLEKEDRLEDFIFSFEESDGYLSGTYVRDKDGVNGACLVCEMYAYYKTHDISLIDKLNKLYEEYGYYQNTLHSYEFEGVEGFNKMQRIMKELRDNPIKQINNNKIVKQLDYLNEVDNLPKSDVLHYYLSDNSSVIIRPSGTEPKLKVYISTVGINKKDSEIKNEELLKVLKNLFN